MNKIISSNSRGLNCGKGLPKQSLCTRNRLALFISLILLAAGTLLPADVAAPVSETNLNIILTQTRQSVEAFWRQFDSVSCIENVIQEKIGRGGKSEYRQKTTFDYLALLNKPEDALSIEEFREQQGKKSTPKNISLLLTDGLPTLLLVFHPYYGENFLYQLDGDEIADGHRLVKIRFRHVPGTRSTTVLRLHDREYPLNLQGVARIDPQTGAIHSIAAGLEAPMKDINLKALQMEVSYVPQDFSSAKDSYWLPSIATVDIGSQQQHWRNVHEYSKYRIFSVNSEQNIQKPVSK